MCSLASLNHCFLPRPQHRFCVEGWAFQIQTWGAGLFGTAYLSAQSVILQIILFSAMLPVGMSVAGSIRVGNFLGNGQPEKAKRAAYSALSIVCSRSIWLMGFPAICGLHTQRNAQALFARSRIVASAR